MSLAHSFRLVLSPPHPAGKPFILAAGVVAVCGLFIGNWLIWLGVAALLFCLYFFRDPERVTPERAGVLVAPADGKVVMVGQAVPPAELGLGEAARWRVAIFLSVLDVHVNRVPAAGTISKIAYRKGKFLNASLDKASTDNERNAIAMRLSTGQEIAVVQIAGLIARRILCDINEGDSVVAGARFGIIRFGSRTDVYLPPGIAPMVMVGQTMIGGETVLAELAG